jgi:hypothetical protein
MEAGRAESNSAIVIGSQCLVPPSRNPAHSGNINGGSGLYGNGGGGQYGGRPSGGKVSSGRRQYDGEGRPVMGDRYRRGHHGSWYDTPDSYGGLLLEGDTRTSCPGVRRLRPVRPTGMAIIEEAVGAARYPRVVTLSEPMAGPSTSRAETAKDAAGEASRGVARGS